VNLFFSVGEELQDLLRSSPRLRQLTLIDMDVREGLFLEMPAQVRCSEGILSRRIRMFLGLPDPDRLVRGTDPDPSLFLMKVWGGLKYGLQNKIFTQNFSKKN
jgi:hypothetical protein